MDVKKTTDFDTGTRTTERKTSAAAARTSRASARRAAASRRTGTIETAGGKTATISGEHQGGQGSTTITGEGGSAHGRPRAQPGRQREARRQLHGQGRPDDRHGNASATGDQSVTKAEGSGGGSAISRRRPRRPHDHRAERQRRRLRRPRRQRLPQDGRRLAAARRRRLVDVERREPADGERQASSTATARPSARRRAGAATATSPATSSTRRARRARDRRAALRRLRQPRRRATAATRSAARGGTAPRSQQSNYSHEQLNRDAAARSGGYQNHQRRTAPRQRGMSRGGGARPRRR